MEVGSSSLPGTTSVKLKNYRIEELKSSIFQFFNFSILSFGGLAQLARAPALQAGGQRFESVILHFPVHSELCIMHYELCIGSFFDILTHKTVSKDFKLRNWVEKKTLNLQLKVWANGERKLGRLVDALALGGDEGRDKLR